MNLHLSILANLIIKQYFDRSNCLLIFSDDKNNFSYNGSLPFVIFEVDDKISESLEFRYFGCQGIVIITENPRSIFEDFETTIRISTNNRFNFRRYLFLPTENSTMMMDIFTSGDLDFVADLLVANKTYKGEGNVNDILGVREEIYDLYTHQYNGVTNNRKIIKVDRWFSNNETFLENSNLYKDKMSDQEGRPFKIATFTYKPYAVPELSDGTELSIAIEVARKYNMTPQLIIDEKGQWGEIFDNWTGYGIIGNVARGHGDICFGSIYAWEHEYNFLDFSKPIIRAGITCLAPAPRLISGWALPFICFNKKMWLMVATSFLVAYTSIFGVHTYDTRTSDKSHRRTNRENAVKSFVLTEAIFLLQGLTKMPHKHNSRIVFALILLLSFMLASLYSCGLASHMTVPRYSGMIRTAKDLAESNVRWGATSNVWIFTIEHDQTYVYKRLLNNFDLLNDDEMIQKNSEHFAFGVERLHGGNLAIADYITPDGVKSRRLMEEDIYSELCVMMLRKNSILLPYVDKVALDIAQTGLTKMWEYQVVARESDPKIQKAAKYSTHTQRPEKTKLAFSHVEGAFYVLYIGLSCSFITFICEVFLCNRNRSLNDIRSHD